MANESPRTMRVAAFLALTALVLAGCASEAPAPDPIPPLPLPASFADTKSDAQVVSAPQDPECVLSGFRPCVVYPFAAEGPAMMSAKLTWERPGAMSMLVLRGDQEIAYQGRGMAASARELSVEAVLPSAGDYKIVVGAQAGYSLNVTFTHHVATAHAALEAPTFGPHVILGIPDTGINPYHELFYRPHLTEHPCTYIRDFPCELPELRLSVGALDWHEAFEKDRTVWENLTRETWYWIPQTVFVAVRCDPLPPKNPVWDPIGQAVFGDVLGGICILDEATSAWAGHGAGTTSIAIMQNPDAYIAFNEGPSIQPFFDAGIPVDVFSASWGSYVPVFYPEATGRCPKNWVAPILVKAGGNDGRPSITDCQNSQPSVIAAGGGFSEPAGHHAMSANSPDVEAHWAPPYAALDSTTRMHGPAGWGGTSFAAPAIAGGLGKVILELRRVSGYNGTLTADGFVDPILGITISDLRDAMNLTATYSPTPRYGTQTSYNVPLNPATPWVQWGWGFYDGEVANATIGHLLGSEPAPPKPDGAVRYMEAQETARKALYG